MAGTASTTPISTYKVYLYYDKPGTSGGVSTKTQVIDIKDFPDLGGEPEMLETTTLSNSMQTYIPGIQNLDSLSFSCNYTKPKYQELVELAKNEHTYYVVFGEDGVDGIFKFKGKGSVYVSGGGVNEVVGMTYTIAPSTDIELVTDSSVSITTPTV